MNGSRWFLLAIMLCIAGTAHSIEAVVSYTVFHRFNQRGEDSAFVEVYWQINPSSLHYKKNEKGELVAQIQTAVSIADEQEVLMRDRYALNTKPALPGTAAAQSILEMKRYHVPAGQVHLRVDLGETEFPEAVFRYSQDLQVVAGKPPYQSRIQLLDTFFATAQSNAFVKNGYLQLPRVLNFYDEGQRRVHFYTELYGAAAADKKPLIRHFYISKKPGEFAIAHMQLSDTIRTAVPDGEGRRYTFDMSTLASGNYYINARLKDTSGAVLDTQSFFFQTINKKPEEVAAAPQDSTQKEGQEEVVYLDLTKTFVSKYNVKQLLAILRMITPIADPAEASAIQGFQRNPDEIYMRYFVYNYFGKENKAHPEVAWKEFSNQIREVNREFNAGGRMGYETDRGIIYLKYGKPDERVRVPNESGAVPYEVWRYNAVGRTNQVGVFIFYQPPFAIADYKYLTSNVTGELQNSGWRNMLYSTGRSSGNGNSRAEQYLEGR
jgi:GWxTD domain-containing protein